MNYISTRGTENRVSLSQALQSGLAPDGGLYVPKDFPRFEVSDFDGLESHVDIGIALLRPFFKGDVLEPTLQKICEEAFNFSIPLRTLIPNTTSILELYHGPTAAFKDVGARFLASCLSRLNEGQAKPLTILVATSGDTGGAVAAAFYQKKNTEVFVLYPKGKVSPRQEQQLTCWGENIRAFAVKGVFDDCQRLVKAAFADDWWMANKRLSSANSINIGRLLPQMVYYAAASLWHWRATGQKANFVIPTGNLGNAQACLWARACGLPIDKVVLATNANRPIVDYLKTGQWQPRATIATLANAMDVGNPSNMERLRKLYPDIEALRGAVTAISVDDELIKRQIKVTASTVGEAICPHTATALYAREQLQGGDWIVVSTAHPAKFEQIVEAQIGREVAMPPALEALMDRPTQSSVISADLPALKMAVLGGVNT